jgi:two-component system sensor histidine kinase CreC
MKLGLRLLLGFFLITGIAGFFVMRVFAPACVRSWKT